MGIVRRIPVLAALAAVAIAVAGFRPVLDRRLSPPGTRNPMVFNSPQDYYSYLSFIDQGRRGSWRMTSMFTPERNRPEFYVPVYALLGHIGRLTGASNDVLFTAARFLLGAVFLGVGYALIRTVIAGERLRFLAALSVLAGPPLWVWADGRFVMRGMEFTGFDPFIRAAFLPHHLAANSCMALAMLVLAGSRTGWTMAAAAALVGIGGLQNPAVMVMGVGAVGLALCSERLERHGMGALVAVGAAAAAVLAWYAHVLTGVFPWNFIAGWESRQMFPIGPGALYLILGGIGLAAPFGIADAWKRGFAGRVVVFWYLGPFLGLALSGVIPIATMRFVQGAPYVPAAILGALGCAAIVRFAAKTGLPHGLAVAMLTGVVAAATIPSLIAGVERQVADARSGAANQAVSVPNAIWDVVSYLSSHGAVGDVVLVGGWEGLPIGAFTGKRTVRGHTIATYLPDQKLRDALSFYAARDTAHMRAILDTYGVRYVFAYRPGFPSAVSAAVGLSEAYANESAIVYAVR